MSQDRSERHFYKHKAPELFEHIEGLMFAGGTEVDIDGVTYNAARDKDENGDEFFVLTPAG